jgi:hypothetical protein
MAYVIRSRRIDWQRFTTPTRAASELGHTSPQMLYSTYRELVLPEEAERYWTILPTEETANVVAFGTST